MFCRLLCRRSPCPLAKRNAKNVKSKIMPPVPIGIRFTLQMIAGEIIVSPITEISTNSIYPDCHQI